MTPTITSTESKTLVGMRINTSISNFGSPKLWQRFMPQRKKIKHAIDGMFFSMQVYPAGFKMEDFTPITEFEYWAAMEVSRFDELPEGMESFTLAEGLYAVFIHKGTMSTFQQTLGYIHGQWLPNSKYEVDDRPHFELLGDAYLGPENPESEEEVWVPIRKKV